jgi:uncharacterized protein YdaU (DUF1376 family)
MTREDAFHSRAAYNAFSDDHKDALRQKRLYREHVPTKKRDTQEQDNASYHVHISALTAILQDLSDGQKDALRQKRLDHDRVPTKKRGKQEQDNAG